MPLPRKDDPGAPAAALERVRYVDRQGRELAFAARGPPKQRPRRMFPVRCSVCRFNVDGHSSLFFRLYDAGVPLPEVRARSGFTRVCCTRYLLSTVDWLSTTLAYEYTNSLRSPADHDDNNAKVYQRPPGPRLAKMPGRG